MKKSSKYSKCKRCNATIENLSDITEITVYNEGKIENINLCPNCKKLFDTFMESSIPVNELRSKVISMIEQGYRNKDIAATLACTENYVGVVRHQYNKSLGRTCKRDDNIEKCYYVPTKKSDIDVGKARALIRAGWSIERIARTELYCTVEDLNTALEDDMNK